MGNQSSILAGMVYRVFPNLEPNQHQLVDQGTSLQSLFSPSPMFPFTRSTSLGTGLPSPSALLGRQNSLGHPLSPPSASSPRDSQQVNRRMAPGNNGVSAATMRMAAELAAMAAHRACMQLKPMAMASFEVASLALRVLDLWDRLSKESIRQLRRSFKQVSAPETLFLFGSFDLRWRIVGIELRRDLGLLTASIASIAERCDAALVDEVQMHCWNVSRKRRRGSLFDADEESMLMTALENMATVTGTLRDEMEALDNLLPSNHPLRIAETNDDDPFSGKKPGAASPKPSPQSNQARRQQMVKSQLVIVQQLQRECLWVQDFDWTVLLLSVALAILWHRFRDAFGRPRVEEGEVSHTLGAAGLSLHYANIILMLDSLVQRPNVITNTRARDEMYQKLPGNVQALLRTRLRRCKQAFDADVVLELRRQVTHFLGWMVPLAEATMAWESERSFSGVMERRQRRHLGETLYYVDRDQFELLLIELLVALTHTLGPRQKTRQAVLAQAELLGHTTDDEADVKLPPVPHATLPRMERRNREAPSPRGRAKPGTPRAMVKVPSREGAGKQRAAAKLDEGEGKGEREERAGAGGEQGEIAAVKPVAAEERQETKQGGGKVPGDLYGAPPNGHPVGPAEGKDQDSPKAQSEPLSPKSSGRRRRPAPRPPPGFGGNQGHRPTHDFRPTLMG